MLARQRLCSPAARLSQSAMASEKWPRPLRDPQDPDDRRRKPGQAGPPDYPGSGRPGQNRRDDPRYGNGPPGDGRNGDGPARDARYGRGAAGAPRYSGGPPGDPPYDGRPAADPRYATGPAADPRYGIGPAADPRYATGPAAEPRYGEGRARQVRYGDGQPPIDARHGDGHAGAGRYDVRAGDPRFGARLPQDPRLGHGAHPAGDPRFPVPLSPGRAPDPRLAADPRFAAEAQLGID